MGKREHILMATLDLIIKEGLQSVTFAKIFKEANVGSGTVYNYFSNKEELINELFKYVSIHMSECVSENYDLTATVYERFKSFLYKLADFAIKYPKEVQFIENYYHSPYISEEYKAISNSTLNQISSIIIDGQKQGLIKNMNIIMCCQISNGLILSVIKGFLNGKYPLNELDIQQAIESSWKAIKI